MPRLDWKIWTFSVHSNHKIFMHIMYFYEEMG